MDQNIPNVHNVTGRYSRAYCRQVTIANRKSFRVCVYLVCCHCSFSRRCHHDSQVRHIQANLHSIPLRSEANCLFGAPVQRPLFCQTFHLRLGSFLKEDISCRKGFKTISLSRSNRVGHDVWLGLNAGLEMRSRITILPTTAFKILYLCGLFWISML